MILAFDLATATGWCAGDGATAPILGTVTMPSNAEVGPFLDFWHRWLNTHLEDLKPEVVVFESPFLPQNMNGGTVRKLMGLAGVLELVCSARKVECFETTATHVKKVLTGSGKSEKPDMLRCARKCGVEPKNYDEADAFGVWIAAVHHHAREHVAKWDAMLYAGKGLL